MAAENEFNDRMIMPDIVWGTRHVRVNSPPWVIYRILVGSCRVDLKRDDSTNLIGFWSGIFWLAYRTKESFVILDTKGSFT